MGDFQDLGVDLEGPIATVEIQRPPNNFFDVALVRAIGDAFHALDREPECRAIVLASQGKNFCAGANFGEGRNLQSTTSTGARAGRAGSGHLYQEGVRLFEAETPIVAAVQGAAIGGGLGLALVADLRVACPESRWSANFARLGFHHGFGLTVTLPAIVGQQKALDLLYTGRRIDGEEAHRIGLADHLVPLERVREKAHEVAMEIAESGPLAVRSIRRTMRRGLADRIRIATDHELVEQDWLRATEDFKEGIAASAERRTPRFQGR
ncbi:MAG TPA: enoyl-CoA hydratase/isomerase family protein [Thermoanaerobaculia bacterium]|nr:enoyl-CoA hydratase/isomerase family protein [Thermoanaerobaculia bacterium]